MEDVRESTVMVGDLVEIIVRRGNLVPTQQRRGKFKEMITNRIFQYRTIKLFKTMKILLKKIKSKNMIPGDKSMRRN